MAEKNGKTESFKKSLLDKLKAREFSVIILCFTCRGLISVRHSFAKAEGSWRSFLNKGLMIFFAGLDNNFVFAQIKRN